VNGGRTAHPGRPPGVPRELVERMYRLHYALDVSYGQISALLNAEGVPLPGGGERWCRSSIERVMHTNYGKAIGQELGFVNELTAHLTAPASQ
jgi:hypothetical protein